ncbi:MAG TPA: hypothetical protein PLQ97_14615 [Myxococcota bacterium]|nr:hypothetical protein [Myxococcota bacterium]HQK51928.1 hypothetical protein [Myxococcota bacterium]
MRIPSRVLIPGLALLCAACSPGVGDSCASNSDCGTELTCDRSQPGGYCTRTPCVRSGCPSNAVCVLYGDQVSYCMARCGPFAFCRPEYTCLEGHPRPDGEDETYPAFCSPAPGPVLDSGDVPPADAP